jgi:hypothetical protein
LVVETGFQVVTDEESASGKGDDSVRYELTLLNKKRLRDPDDASVVTR